MLKLFIVGHPHSGTTILRKIMGIHSDMLDIPREVRLPLDTFTAETKTKKQKLKGFVCKCPLVNLNGEEFFKHNDIHTIAIIKEEAKREVQIK